MARHAAWLLRDCTELSSYLVHPMLGAESVLGEFARAVKRSTTVDNVLERWDALLYRHALIEGLPLSHRTGPPPRDWRHPVMHDLVGHLEHFFLQHRLELASLARRAHEHRLPPTVIAALEELALDAPLRRIPRHGQIVQVQLPAGPVVRGKVRFVGRTSFADGDWVGLELLDNAGALGVC